VGVNAARQVVTMMIGSSGLPPPPDLARAQQGEAAGDWAHVSSLELAALPEQKKPQGKK